MSKFAAQQLFAGKAISLLGYCSRKVEGVSSALMEWWSKVVLSFFLPFFSKRGRAGHHNRWIGTLLMIITPLLSGEVFSGCSYDEVGVLTDELTGLPCQPIAQNPPKAAFTASPLQGEVPLTVTLDASASSDPEDSISHYDWTVNGRNSGSDENDKNVRIVLTEEGIYTIVLTVTDIQGLTDSSQQTITVGPPQKGEIKVISITSKYPDNVHYLDGLDHEVTYIAEIDWGKLEPGTVSFITPKGTEDVTATGNTTEQAFNMGKDFGACGKLKVIATSKDGTKSPKKEANFVIMSKPFFKGNLTRIGEDNNSFHYSLGSGGLNWEVINAVYGPTGTPDPIFGKNGLGLRFIPTVNIKITSEGETEVSMDFEGAGKTLAEKENAFKLGDFKIELHPTVSVNGTFQESSCEWQWSGDVGLSGGGNLSIPPFKFVVFAGPVPVPMYVKSTFAVNASGAFTIEKVEPFTPKGGKLTVSPSARASLGVGVSDILAGEGWLQAGGELEWGEVPIKQTRGAIVDKIGAAVVALSWKWEGEALSCEWDFVTNVGKCTSPFIRSRYATNPTLIERDYLTIPDYATFRKTDRGMRDVSTTTTPLQATVFPYSDAHLSSNSNSLYAVWLMDNPARTAINRTVASFSSYDAADWSDLQAIADDGTADFHPKLVAFYDNSALATWEDVKVALPDTAQLEEMVQNLEISVSKYDPQTKQWTGTQRLTNNAYLDRSPKIAGKDALILGQPNQAIVTWISNPGNDLFGNATQPNQLWSAQWLNNAWTTPQQVVDVPYPLFKYDLVYNGQTAYVVMSVDTDGDLTTIADHELFQIAFTNGTWGTLTRLTNDTLADDNPQLGIDPKGNFMLVWLKENELSSVVNFDFNTRVVVRKDESGYSSNLADFKLATSADGKLALVWAEPSAYYSSDLHTLFYKPLVNLWGNPKQLTLDPETEKRVTAAFYGNDTLIALYNRGPVGELPTEVTVNSNSLSTDQPTMVSTDLFMLKHTVRNADFTTTDLPELGAIATNNTFAISETGDLMNTQTVLNGGLSINGGPFKRLVEFKENLGHGEDAQTVTVKGVITPAAEHDGKIADIFAYGEFKPYTEQELNDTTCPVPPADPNAVPYYVMESLPKNYVVWNGPKTSATIPAFLYKDVTLTAGKSQEFTLFEGPFDARGCLSISFGYRLQDSGVVVYNHHTATVDNGIGVTVRKK